MVELAVCVPVVMLLALGAAAVVQISDARAGLAAATEAAAAAAARAPDAAGAKAASAERFAAIVAAYPLRSPGLEVTFSSFDRAAQISATGRGYVDVGWAVLIPVSTPVLLEVHAVTRLESWRTHDGAP